MHCLHPQVLVFVNDAEAGMRARLFLEAFGVRAALLNAELPLNSRHHILQVGLHLNARCNKRAKLLVPCREGPI